MTKYLVFFLVVFICSAYGEQPYSINTQLPYDHRSDTVDIRHTSIDVDISDYASRAITAHATLYCKSKINALSGSIFDLRAYTVDSVKVDGSPTTFSVLAQSLRVNYLSFFNLNDSFTVDFYYHGTPFQDITDFGGFFWNNNYAYNIGVSFTEVQHSYGRILFPCFDNFVERCTYSYRITTDSTRKAFCGGLLDSVVNEIDGSKTWCWKNNQEIPSYLASVTIARYATLSDTFNGMDRVIPIQIGVLPVDSVRLKNSFINLHDALRIFEERYGPYRFDRVGYCVTDYSSGAMEHACNITYPSYAVNGTLAYQTTMAHELSHHWWGDLVTCENAAEMWLNEGWATYSENIFTEGLYGLEAYKSSVRLNHARVLQFAHVRDSGYYSLADVPSKYTYGNTSYLKGADIAHTLRGYMGDSAFFSAIKDYMNASAFSNKTSAQFRDFITTSSSFDATSFFDDWVFAPGFPQFSIDYSQYSGGQLKLWISQKLDHAPHYYSNVPMEICVFDASFEKHIFTVMLSGRCNLISLNVPFQPTYIALDFNEKLSDAISDEYSIVTLRGLKNYTLAKLIIDTRNIGADSILMRVEHNYVAPDPSKFKVPGLHLHTSRYWNIDGIFDDTLMNANATFTYNGTNSLTNGFLDNDFITNSEDSLILMYRRDGTKEWQRFDSTMLVTAGSVTDKNGKIIAYNIKKGQYCFAIYDFRYEDTSNYIKDCNLSDIKENGFNGKNQIEVYPNPAQNTIKITIPEFLSNSTLNLYSILGTLVYSFDKLNTKEITIDTKSISNGVYIIEYFNNNSRYSARFIIQK